MEHEDRLLLLESIAAKHNDSIDKITAALSVVHGTFETVAEIQRHDRSEWRERLDRMEAHLKQLDFMLERFLKGDRPNGR
jgi:hypothetical protein